MRIIWLFYKLGVFFVGVVIGVWGCYKAGLQLILLGTIWFLFQSAGSLAVAGEFVRPFAQGCPLKTFHNGWGGSRHALAPASLPQFQYLWGSGRSPGGASTLFDSTKPCPKSHPLTALQFCYKLGPPARTLTSRLTRTTFLGPSW